MDTNPTARSTQSPNTPPRENPTPDARQVPQHTDASIRPHSTPVVTGRIPHSSPASAMTFPPQNNNMSQTNSVTGNPCNTSNTERGPRTKRAERCNQETLSPQQERDPRYERYYAFIRSLNENNILARLTEHDKALLGSIEPHLMALSTHIHLPQEISLDSFDCFVSLYARTRCETQHLESLSRLTSLPKTIFSVAKSSKTPFGALWEMVNRFKHMPIINRQAVKTLLTHYPCNFVMRALGRDGEREIQGKIISLLSSQAKMGAALF